MKLRPALVITALVLALAGPAVAYCEEALAQVSPEGLREILAGPLTPASHAPREADVTIVVYFDYNCPVCRQLDPVVAAIAKDDPGIRVVHKHWPIFGAVSAYAAYAAFAADAMGEYAGAHAALYHAPGGLKSPGDVDAALARAGFDVAALKERISANQPAYSAVLTRNQEEAQALSLYGTPGLVIGDQRVAGAPSRAQIEQLVEAVRAALHR